jgi:hypothetical protein
MVTDYPFDAIILRSELAEDARRKVLEAEVKLKSVPNTRIRSLYLLLLLYYSVPLHLLLQYSEIAVLS